LSQTTLKRRNNIFTCDEKDLLNKTRLDSSTIGYVCASGTREIRFVDQSGSPFGLQTGLRRGVIKYFVTTFVRCQAMSHCYRTNWTEPKT